MYFYTYFYAGFGIFAGILQAGGDRMLLEGAGR